MAPTEADPLRELVAAQLESACPWPDPTRDQLIATLRDLHGNSVVAILLYGSYLRGKRDTLLDFYVLVENYGAMPSRWQAALAWLLSPNVYQVRIGSPGQETRAKYALMTAGRFGHAMRCDFHSYFWARFAQPSGLLYCRDESTRRQVTDAVADAAGTFVRRVIGRLGDEFTAQDLVSRGLQLSYAAELRSEKPGHAATLYAHDADYYEALVAALARGSLGFEPAPNSAGETGARYRNLNGPARRTTSRVAWMMRTVQGKVLSVLRLLKAALTFAGGFDYLLWKIERHSGVHVEASLRQRKYPLVFGWPVLLRLYRQGGFR